MLYIERPSAFYVNPEREAQYDALQDMEEAWGTLIEDAVNWPWPEEEL